MLSAYSLSQLQEARSLLAVARGRGLTLDELVDAIDARVQLPAQPMPQKIQSSRRICPSCGLGQLAPVINREGLSIVGCARCRYSRIEVR